MPFESPSEVFIDLPSSARSGLTDACEEADRARSGLGPSSFLDGYGRSRVWIWGVAFSPMTREVAAQVVMELISTRQPSMFITANTHYTMLCYENPELREVNSRAAFVLADGAPLVWASRWKSTPLPERVAGSDLIFDLCGLAQDRGFRPFLLGGEEGVAEAAARSLVARFPGLQIAGTACPSPSELAALGGDDIIERVREARPDLLFAALGQPKGELWLDRHLDRLGVPVCVQIGASLDFIAGRVSRAPRWVQRLGMEWAYRMSLEPRRLGPRYGRNARFLLAMVAGDLARWARGRKMRGALPSLPEDRQRAAEEGSSTR
jgi:N-acetylglucosaminyldiphosphoundecaprenol N-acetyl-beta-D-mannosaminyltransferase